MSDIVNRKKAARNGQNKSNFLICRAGNILAAGILVASSVHASIAGSSFASKTKTVRNIGAGIVQYKIDKNESGPASLSFASRHMPAISNGRPKSLDEISKLSENVRALGTAGVSSSVNDNAEGTPQPDAYQGLGWPNSHERVSVTGTPGRSDTQLKVPVTSRPYRFIGKLEVELAGETVECTAAIIRRGLIVTTAHCVQGFGQGSAVSADTARWYPAHYQPGGGYYGYYEMESFFVPLPFADGSDTCITIAGATPDPACNNDIAVIALKRRSGIHAGATLQGHLRYSWNGYSFQHSSEFGNSNIAIVSQFGYEEDWDSGNQMQRNTTISKYYQVTGDNGQVFKFQRSASPIDTDGGSGSPWIVNFGTLANETGNAQPGFSTVMNIIIGVSSWHKRSYTLPPAYNPMLHNSLGSSWFGQNYEYPAAAYGNFGAGNIGALVQAACTALPDNC